MRKHRARTATLGWVLGVLLLACNGSLQAQNVSLAISDDTIEEHDRSIATITATIESALENDLTVELESSGAAKLGADYDLEPLTITIKAGETEGTTSFIPIRDWIEDGDEVAEINIKSSSTDDSNQDPPKVSITIEDSFQATDGASEPVSGSDLIPITDLRGKQDSIDVQIFVYNLGSEESRPGTLTLLLFEYPNIYQNEQVLTFQTAIPSVATFPQSYRYTHSITFEDLNPSKTYIGLVDVTMTINSNDLEERNNDTVFGFALNSEKTPAVKCEQPERAEPTVATDPLLAHQWHIENTGQRGFSQEEGVEGADLRMKDTIAAGYTGDGVVVSIVDEGLEICHPELQANVDTGKSQNFLADSSSTRYWFGANNTDPFNPEPTGDHGTAVAGVIAGIADNGRGGRGIAPKARIRGFNYLKNWSFNNLVTAFGGSDPNTNDIDIVNMSYGALLTSDYNPGTYDLFGWGTRTLRDEKGALFVKAAGNSFSSCGALFHEIHQEIGCRSATSDYTNNLPFVLVTGAFTAKDVRASYASTGSNIWISAPAGMDGTEEAATITTDQHGSERGYGTVYLDPLWAATNSAMNPNRDYSSIFNGTSSAAAAVSGALAVLLEVQPELTFRDVKHILAKTARVIEPDLRRVRVAIDEVPYVLQHAWTQNAAGYNYHNWFGFGAVDLDAAVSMAKEFDLESLGLFAVSDWVGNDLTSDENPLEIPDENGGGVVDTLDVTLPLPYQVCLADSSERHCIVQGSLDAQTDPDDPDGSPKEIDVHIEGVQLRFIARHPHMSDLGIHLISPSGTESILNPVFSNAHAIAIDDVDQFHFLSNAFYGESPVGEWQIKVVDVLGGATGEIVSWDLKFFVGQHPDIEN